MGMDAITALSASLMRCSTTFAYSRKTGPPEPITLGGLGSEATTQVLGWGP